MLTKSVAIRTFGCAYAIDDGEAAAGEPNGLAELDDLQNGRCDRDGDGGRRHRRPRRLHDVGRFWSVMVQVDVRMRQNHWTNFTWIDIVRVSSIMDTFYDYKCDQGYCRILCKSPTHIHRDAANSAERGTNTLPTLRSVDFEQTHARARQVADQPLVVVRPYVKRCHDILAGILDGMRMRTGRY